MPEQYDLGEGFSFTFFSEKDIDDHTGLIITGPAAPQCKHKTQFNNEECSGGIHFENSQLAAKENRPMWKVEDNSIENLTLSPSIQCGCGGQHGFIQCGKYIKV